MDGRKDFSIKLPPNKGGRNSKFRHHHPIAILGVPHVVVRKAVHVHIQPLVGVPVHIRNEVLCNTPPVPLPAKSKIYDRLYRIWDIQVLQCITPTDYFLFYENNSSLLQDVSDKILENILIQSSCSSRNRSTVYELLHEYTKNPWSCQSKGPRVKESKGQKNQVGEVVSCGNTTRRQSSALHTLSRAKRRTCTDSLSPEYRSTFATKYSPFTLNKKNVP